MAGERGPKPENARPAWLQRPAAASPDAAALPARRPSRPPTVEAWRPGSRRARRRSQRKRPKSRGKPATCALAGLAGWRARAPARRLAGVLVRGAGSGRPTLVPHAPPCGLRPFGARPGPRQHGWSAKAGDRSASSRSRPQFGALAAGRVRVGPVKGSPAGVLSTRPVPRPERAAARGAGRFQKLSEQRCAGRHSSLPAALALLPTCACPAQSLAGAAPPRPGLAAQAVGLHSHCSDPASTRSPACVGRESLPQPLAALLDRPSRRLLLQSPAGVR